VPPWTEIGDRVFVRRYAFYDQNIGVVLGAGATLVIDTRSTHVQGREILDDLRALTADPVRVVVNTHGHFDHAFGNRVFRPATIWGHAACPPFMVRTGDARRARIAADKPEIATDLMDVELDPPDHVFAEEATIEVGGRRVELRYLGRGHTDHDIVVSVPDANVVFAGDLIEGGAVPFFNDGYPLDWPETGFRLAELVRGTVVPGHGDHAGFAFAAEQAEAFRAIAELGRRIQRGDLTIDDALELTPFPQLPHEDLRAPLQRTLAQLRGELD
jgi:glyoxylase-like metal-dependent hydrolase (beta-lactamase superfamily II)